MQTAIDPLDDTLVPAQVAEVLHTTEASLAQMRFRGKGPRFIKVGSRVLYRRSDIRAFLDANTIQRTGDTPGLAAVNT
jgi:hypothetical protein